MSGRAVYRSLFRAILRLPEGRQAEAKTMARSEFRANRSVTGEELAKAMKRAQQSKEYVEMLTPKVKRKTAGRFVIGKDGELVEAGAKGSGVPGLMFESDKRITDEQLKRHHVSCVYDCDCHTSTDGGSWQQLVRRQHFMDRT